MCASDLKIRELKLELQSHPEQDFLLCLFRTFFKNQILESLQETGEPWIAERDPRTARSAVRSV